VKKKEFLLLASRHFGAILKMEHFCKNCQYFEVKSIKKGIHIWGLCARPKSEVFKAKIRKDEKLFKWGDARCVEFKLIEERKPVLKR
jgi:hypothetical protein